MRTLVIVLIAVGVLLGADEVAVIAAAKTLDSTTGGAPLLAVWGVGSFIGGLLVARLGGGARTAAGLALAARRADRRTPGPDPGGRERRCARGRAARSPAPRSRRPKPPCTRWSTTPPPAATITEAFAWLATAMAVGGAVGSGERRTRRRPRRAHQQHSRSPAAPARSRLLTTMLRSRTLAPRQGPATTLIDTDSNQQLAHQAAA